MSSQTESQLISYIAESQKARSVLAQLVGLDLTEIDIQNALCDKRGITDLMNLLALSLDAQSIIDELRNYDFTKYRPEILREFEADESLIPDDVPRLLTEKTVKVKGEIWRVHKSDADSFPSNPHAHNCETGYKLHLGSGELFDSARNSKGKINKKKLKAVRDKLSGIELPPADG